ncbi:aldehyde dehydrogenase [Bdellovibrio sp. HCB337]|uniref:aldehyde dehydrogenase n=1 Tax=Bdellovibrio sp. HCB337 TaxID=3394358 RepID=UPI0039A54A58
MKKILNYINGELKEPKNKKFLDNVNPATGQVYSLVPDSSEADVSEAVAAAEQAFPAWSQTSVETRVRFMRKIADKIQEKHDALTLAESIDSGKPVSVSGTVDIPRSKTNFEFFADAMTQFHGETFQTDTRALNYVTYSPLGVVACISPWNLPLYLFTWKIAPALVAGNTVVAKPSELTPMTAFLLSEIAIEVGLPKGVLNIIHGRGPEVGAPMVNHPSIKAVSFTGSTATGRHIAQSIAGSFKKISLEMGGKNANIVFADCDFNKAVETTVRSSFSNQGQICLCGSRIFVEKSIYEKFKAALVEKTLQLKQGDPLKPETQQGAVVSKDHQDKVFSYIEHAKGEKATILCGGKKAEMGGEFAGGYYIQPTLIEGLSYQSKVNQEEIFGPVATLTPFESEDEVLKMVNSTKYGLAASVWTQDLKRGHRIAQKIESGIVWVNTWMLRDLRTPFGGVKESGVGREGGKHALEFMSEVKNICIGME